MVSSATVMWWSSANARTRLRACAVPIPRWCIRPAGRRVIGRSFASLLDGESWTIEMACRTKSGTFLPTEIALLAFDSGSKVYVISLPARPERASRMTDHY